MKTPNLRDAILQICRWFGKVDVNKNGIVYVTMQNGEVWDFTHPMLNKKLSKIVAVKDTDRKRYP